MVEVKRGQLKDYNDKRKKVHKAVKEENLQVIIEDAKQGIDFLDVSLNLVTKVYTPYTKPGDKLCYVDTRSNHPPSVFKAVPRGVAKRIATNSSSRKEFEAAKGPLAASNSFLVLELVAIRLATPLGMALKTDGG